MIIRMTLTAIAVGLCMSGTAAAQDDDGRFLENEGGGERIDEAGRLRMLSQRIAGAHCYHYAGVAVEDATALLDAAVADYDRILNALRSGDLGFGIVGEEDDRRVVRQIDAVRAVWEPMRERIEATQDHPTQESVRFIAAQAEPLLREAQLLVSEVVREYSNNTDVLPSDAMRLDIAGRQRMLAQRMSKALCIGSMDVNREGAVAELAEARALYDASAKALRFGMPEAGILPVDDAAIAIRLDAVLADWAAVQDTIDATMDGGGMDPAAAERMYRTFNGLTQTMDEVVAMLAIRARIDL